jgi:hypothetical protein
MPRRKRGGCGANQNAVANLNVGGFQDFNQLPNVHLGRLCSNATGVSIRC